MAKEKVETKTETTEPKLVRAMLQASIIFGGHTKDHWKLADTAGLKMRWIRGEGLHMKLGNDEVLVPSTNVKGAFFAHE